MCCAAVMNVKWENLQTTVADGVSVVIASVALSRRSSMSDQ